MADLKTARAEHACGWFSGERVTLVVVGGHNQYNGEDSLNLQAYLIIHRGLNLIVRVPLLRRDNDDILQ